MVAILIALFFSVALYIRVYFPYEQVFGSDWIKYTGIDAYYQMRLVDNLVQNFPHRITFDPYFVYPGGKAITIQFFNQMLAGIIWIIGLGSPSQHLIDVVGVYFPAVLGALLVIPVYFLGKTIFGRWAGVLAAGLIAVSPGELLGRSMLGFTDYHVAETLFTVTAMLFLLLAIKAAKQSELTLRHLYQRDWARGIKTLAYSLLAGIILGIYLITWAGGPLFVFIITLFLVVQLIIDHLRRKSTDYLCLISVIVFLVALLMYLPVVVRAIYLYALIMAILIPIILYSVSWFLDRREIKPAYYPAALFGLGLAGLAIFYLVMPGNVSAVLSHFRIFFPTGVSLTTIEMQHMFFPAGKFSTQVAWGNFPGSLLLYPADWWPRNLPVPGFGIIALGFLIYHVIKHGSAEKSLLVVWSLVILAATLGQRRFAYYLAVNMALLTGYFSWRILERAGINKLGTQPAETSTRAERRKVKLRGRQRGGLHITSRHLVISAAMVIIFFVVYVPNFNYAKDVAKQARFAPTDAWHGSMDWLRENTPDPFDTPDFYNEIHERPLVEESYYYPESAYGVMSWWDYGYWIARIARRLPNASPGQDVEANTKAALFFTSQDEKSANGILDELDSAYVVIDYQTATNKFWAIATWAGRGVTEFFEVYYLPQDGQLRQTWLFYPEYYRAMSTRLFNFDGKATDSGNTWVIWYEEKKGGDGSLIKQITDRKEFPNYEAAVNFISGQKSANLRVVGVNPYVSLLTLEKLGDYKLVHSSAGMVAKSAGGVTPEVKIFEYTGGKQGPVTAIDK